MDVVVTGAESVALQTRLCQPLWVARFNAFRQHTLFHADIDITAFTREYLERSFDSIISTLTYAFTTLCIQG